MRPGGAGNERFIFSDMAVTDKETGLMWTRDANIAGKCMNWYDALKFIKQLNKQKYSGHSDWRLPTKWELQTLVDLSSEEGIINLHKLEGIGLKNVQANHYWSSTTADAYSGFMNNACLINMLDDYMFAFSKPSNAFMWPVRAGQ